MGFLLLLFILASVSQSQGTISFNAFQNSFLCLETKDIRCTKSKDASVPLELCPYSLDLLRNPTANIQGYNYAMNNIKLRNEWYCRPKEYNYDAETYIKAHDIGFKVENYETLNLYSQIKNNVYEIIENKEEDATHQTFISSEKHGMLSKKGNNWVLTGDAWEQVNTEVNFNAMYLFTPCHTKGCLVSLIDWGALQDCTPDKCHVVFPVNLFNEYDLRDTELEYFSVYITGAGETYGTTHLIGIDPTVYEIEKRILKTRAALMREYWYKEWDFSITQQTCADKAQWNSDQVEETFDDQNKACGQCLPWKRANQAVATMWFDQCQYNQGGWHYENAYHAGTADWRGWKDNPEHTSDWNGELTAACRKCKKYMDCRCEHCSSMFGYISTFWVHDKYNYASNGDKYGIHQPWTPNDKEWPPYGENDLGHTRCRSVEYELLPKRTRVDSSERQRTTLATEVKNWRAIITSIGVNGGLRGSSRRSREALLDLLMDSKTVLYGQEYAEKKKEESTYDKFFTKASELCAGGNIQTTSGWCQRLAFGDDTFLTPWPFDPTKVMLDYSVIYMLLELDNRITYAIDTILDDKTWEVMNNTLGKWSNFDIVFEESSSGGVDMTDRRDYLGTFIDMVSLDKITERSIWLQTQSKKWSDELSSDERFRNKFFWRASDSSASDEIRSEVAETIYANSAIHGIKKGDIQIDYAESDDMKSMKLKKEVVTPYPDGWNPWTKTRDGEGTQGYAAPTADDADIYTFKSVWENRGWWKREGDYENNYLQGINNMGFNETRRYLDYQYKTLWEALKTKGDPENPEETPWKHRYALQDEPEHSIETIEDGFGTSLGTNFADTFDYTYYEDEANDIEAEKSVLKTFISPEFVNKLGKDYNIWNVRKAIEVYEKVSKVTNPYRGSLKYIHARKKAQIFSSYMPTLLEEYNLNELELMDENRSGLPDEQPHWFSNLNVDDEYFFVGKHTVSRAVPPISTSLDLTRISLPILQGSVNEGLSTDTLRQKRIRECKAECEDDTDASGFVEICKGKCQGNTKTVEIDSLIDILRLTLDGIDYFLLGEQPDSLTQGIKGKTEEACKGWRDGAEKWAETYNKGDDADYTAWRLKLLKRDDTGIRLSARHPAYPIGVSAGRGTWSDVGFYFGTNMRPYQKKQNHFCGWANGRGGWWSIGIQSGSSVPVSLEVLTGKGFGFQISLAVENYENLVNFELSDNIANFYHPVEESMQGIQVTLDMKVASANKKGGKSKGFITDAFGKIGKALKWSGIVVGDGVGADLTMGVSTIRPRTVDIKEWRDNCKHFINLMDNGESAAKDAALFQADQAARADQKEIDCSQYKDNENLLALSRKNMECKRLEAKKCSQSNQRSKKVCEGSLSHNLARCKNELETLLDKSNVKEGALEKCHQHYDEEERKADESMRKEYGVNYFVNNFEDDLVESAFAEETFDNSWRMGAETFVTSFTGLIPETDEVLPSFFEGPQKKYKSSSDKGRFCDKQCQEDCESGAIDKYVCAMVYDGRFCDEDCENTCRIIDKEMASYKKHPCDVSFLFLAKSDPDKAAEETAKCHACSTNPFDDDYECDPIYYYFQKPVFLSFEFVMGSQSADSIFTHVMGTITAAKTTAAYKAISTTGHKLLDEADKAPEAEQQKIEDAEADFVNYKLSRITDSASAKVLSGTVTLPGNPYWSIAEPTVVVPMYYNPSIPDENIQYSSNQLRPPPLHSVGFDLIMETETANYTGLSATASYANEGEIIELPDILLELTPDLSVGKRIDLGYKLSDGRKVEVQKGKDNLDIINNNKVEDWSPWEIVSGRSFFIPTKKQEQVTKTSENTKKGTKRRYTVTESRYEIGKFTVPESRNGTEYTYNPDRKVFQNVKYYTKDDQKYIFEDRSLTISKFRFDKKDGNKWKTNSVLNIPVRLDDGSVIIGHIGHATAFEGRWNADSPWDVILSGIIDNGDIGPFTKVLPIMDHEQNLAFAIGDTIYFGEEFSNSEANFAFNVYKKFKISKGKYCNSAFIAPVFGDADGDDITDIIYLNSESDIRYCKGLDFNDPKTENWWDCGIDDGGVNDNQLIHENHPNFDKQSTYITKDLTQSHCEFVLSTYDGTISCLERNMLNDVQEYTGTNTSGTNKYTWTLHQDNYEGVYEPIYAESSGSSQTGCGKKCGKTAKRIATSMHRHFTHHKMSADELKEDAQNYAKMRQQHLDEDAARQRIQQQVDRNVVEADRRKANEVRHQDRAKEERIASGEATDADKKTPPKKTDINNVLADVGVDAKSINKNNLKSLPPSVRLKLDALLRLQGKKRGKMTPEQTLDAVKKLTEGAASVDMNKFHDIVKQNKEALLKKHRETTADVAVETSLPEVTVKNGKTVVESIMERVEKSRENLEKARKDQTIFKKQKDIDDLNKKINDDIEGAKIEETRLDTIKAEDDEMRRFGRPFLVELDDEGNVKKYDKNGDQIPFGHPDYYKATSQRKYIIPNAHLGLSTGKSILGGQPIVELHARTASERPFLDSTVGRMIQRETALENGVDYATSLRIVTEQGAQPTLAEIDEFGNEKKYNTNGDEVSRYLFSVEPGTLATSRRVNPEWISGKGKSIKVQNMDQFYYEAHKSIFRNEKDKAGRLGFYVEEMRQDTLKRQNNKDTDESRLQTLNDEMQNLKQTEDVPVSREKAETDLLKAVGDLELARADQSPSPGPSSEFDSPSTAELLEGVPNAAERLNQYISSENKRTETQPAVAKVGEVTITTTRGKKAEIEERLRKQENEQTSKLFMGLKHQGVDPNRQNVEQAAKQLAIKHTLETIMEEGQTDETQNGEIREKVADIEGGLRNLGINENGNVDPGLSCRL